MDFDKAQAVTARVHAAKPSPEPQYSVVMRPELYKQIVNYWGDFADYLHSIDAEPNEIGVNIEVIGADDTINSIQRVSADMFAFRKMMGEYGGLDEMLNSGYENEI